MAPPRILDGPRRTLRYVTALALTALGAAAFAIAFRGLLRLAFEATAGVEDVVTAVGNLPAWARWMSPPLGALLAGVAVRVADRGSGGSSVGAVMEVVVLGRGRISLWRTSLRATGSWLAIVSGGSIGREGPLIQFGGALGSTFGRLLGVRPRQARVLIAAGVAAGFASAYNTPIAGVLFVIEVVAGVAALEAILPAIAASALATILTHAIVGGLPTYGARSFAMATDWELLAHIGVGVVGGVVGVGFMRLLAAGEHAFARPWLPQPWRAACGGLLVGGLVVALPEVAGNGYEPLSVLIGGGFSIGMLALLALAKAVGTTSSVGSGSPGGVFTPALLMGASAGALVGHALGAIVGVDAIGPIGGYALVGMAATTAATTHAPLLAAVMMVELSGDYAMVLPLLLAAATATATAKRLRRDSLYTAELRARGGGWEVTLEGRKLGSVSTGDFEI